MKKIIVFTVLIVAACFAGVQSYEQYLKDFTYETRTNMRVNEQGLYHLLVSGKAQLVDIRFKEEYAVWHMGVGTNIPLNELPSRLDELDTNKIIITACPHKDRAIMAMTYLQSKGYNAQYLSGGLLKFMDLLRGDTARDFYKQMGKNAFEEGKEK